MDIKKDGDTSCGKKKVIHPKAVEGVSQKGFGGIKRMNT